MPTLRARTSKAPAAVAWLVTLTLVALSLREAMHATFGYPMYADRDLVRGLRFFQDVPTSGAELSAGVGARVPGALLGVVFGLPQWLGGDANAVFLFQVLLESLAVVWLHQIVARRQGPLAGLAAAAVMLGSTSEIANVAALWNPGFLPLFVVGAYDGFDRAVVARRWTGVVQLAWFAALGAQLHLSMVLVATPMLLVLVLQGLPTPRRAWPASVAAIALAYAPYLWGEALTGFSNGRDLGQQDVVARGLSSFTAAPVRWLHFVQQLIGDPWTEAGHVWVARSEGAVHAAVWLLVCGAVGVHALVAARVARAGRTSAPTDVSSLADAAILVSGIGYLSTDATLGPHARYVVAFVPVWARLVANTVHAVSGPVAAPRAPWRLAGIAAAIVTVGAVSTPGRPRFFPATTHDPHTYAGALAEIADLRARTGWSLAEVTGRTAWLSVEGDTLRAAFGPTFDHVLAQQGKTFPGSLPPPCALMLDASTAAPGQGPWDPARALASLLGPDAVATLDAEEVRPREWRVLYTPRRGRCPTTMAQRYNATPVEATLRAVTPDLRCGSPETVPIDEPDTTLWAIRYDIDPRLCDATYTVGVALRRTGDGVVATLHGNQLRGHAPNVGYYDPVIVDRPRLTFTPDAGGPPVELGLAEGRVGSTTENTPLHAIATLPDGAWTVRFTMDVLADKTMFPIPADLPVRNTVDVVLATGWSSVGVN